MKYLIAIAAIAILGAVVALTMQVAPKETPTHVAAPSNPPPVKETAADPRPELPSEKPAPYVEETGEFAIPEDQVPPPVERPRAGRQPANLDPLAKPKSLHGREVRTHRKLVGPSRAADDAYQQKKYDISLTRAEEALEISPEARRARMTATKAACALGKLDVAQEHAGQLDDGRFYRAVTACSRHGVTLNPGTRPPPEDPL